MTSDDPEEQTYPRHLVQKQQKNKIKIQNKTKQNKNNVQNLSKSKSNRSKTKQRDEIGFLGTAESS